MGDPTAAWLEQALPGALAHSLAAYMRRRPQWSDAGGADRHSLSRIKRRRPRLLWTNPGHHQRSAPAQMTARRRRRERAAAGDLQLFPDGGRPAAVRAGLAGPGDHACASLRWLGAKGTGSLDDFAPHPPLRDAGRGTVRRTVEGRPNAISPSRAMPRGFASDDLFFLGFGAQPEGNRRDGRQRHDSPGRA